MAVSEVFEGYDRVSDAERETTEQSVSTGGCIWQVRKQLYFRKLVYWLFLQLKGERQMKNNQNTILTLNDMTCLITIYDAIRQLNMALYGFYEPESRNEGIMGALSNVWDVIVNGTCAEIHLLEENEFLSQVLHILGESATPRERAKLLLGMK